MREEIIEVFEVFKKTAESHNNNCQIFKAETDFFIENYNKKESDIFITEEEIQKIKKELEEVIEEGFEND
ncbi:hypothetical protein HOK00_10425 [bacterium]|jgi:hypothetical protein|nr:hypothetical protein [bacterium]